MTTNDVAIYVKFFLWLVGLSTVAVGSWVNWGWQVGLLAAGAYLGLSIVLGR